MRRFKALLSALSSCRRRGGTQTHSSSMPGSFKPCGFHGKTVDWMRSHTETVWNAERLQIHFTHKQRHQAKIQTRGHMK